MTHPTHPILRHDRPRGGAGFTLVELMISIALALMLIYGVSQVFKLSGDTVGANQAVSTIVRDHRAASSTLLEDFRNSIPDSPLFLISSRVAYGVDPLKGGKFYNAGWKNAEERRDVDAATNAKEDPAVQEINGSLFTYGVTQYTDRTPRVDRLGFFARNLYRRQTAGKSQVTSTVTGTDAYIWYGHVALPSGSGGWLQPEEQFGVDRVLGRVAILLKDPSSFSTAALETENAIKPQAGDPLGPLAVKSFAYRTESDLAAITLEQWRQLANDQYLNRPARAYGGPVDWFRPMEGVPTIDGGVWRAYSQPTVTRPITQEKLAQTSSYFVGHCTQFIVEYAGDYLKQDPADATEPGKVLKDSDPKQKVNGVASFMPQAGGDVQYGETDGEIDYVIDTTQCAGPPFTAAELAQRGVRRIRWYGMPRDVDGDGRIRITDVVPLADVLAYYGVTMRDPVSGQPVPVIGSFEDPKGLPIPGLTDSTMKVDSSKNRQLNYDYSKFPNASSAELKYTCAWHNDAPPMIRVTMKIDDPSGKLRDGQWYQYVLHR
jgi:prepilin-type N-terminal cleavage/methylation domain-containing protein